MHWNDFVPKDCKPADIAWFKDKDTTKESHNYYQD